MRLIPVPAGTRFGRLATTGERVIRAGRTFWVCRCDCGQTALKSGAGLRAGAAVSCGCAQVPHGCARRSGKAPEYHVWQCMLKRCSRPANKDYKYYGGRGIRVCDAWSDFRQFMADMGPRPSPRHSIDRKDSNGHYEPGNCRWATLMEQRRNQRGNHHVQWQGTMATISEWAERIGIAPSTLRSRFRDGWPVERALTTRAGHAS
jgi:hypothetical protein